MKSFTVGALANNAGVNVETVRYYEKIGLMPKPKRKESRYRVYDESDLARLKFIFRAKQLGFTLKEIKELLELRIESKATFGYIKNLSSRKIEDIEQRINDLQNIKKVLTKLIHQCVNEELSSEECPILEAIEH
jgi:Hg(II)-responsive transcriptional regulator